MPPQPTNQQQQQPTPHRNQNNRNRNQNQNQNTNQNQNQNQNRRRPRRAFGSQLTQQQQPRPTTQPQPDTQLASLSLSQRLIKELSTSTYDCSICITPIRPHHPIYHCPNCYAVFHLNCSSKWASRSVADTSEKAILLRDRDHVPSSPDAIKGEWRCPGCQHPHCGAESIPTQYTCWCRKVSKLNIQNHPPHHRRSKIPHSCDQRCAKTPAHGCIHGCTEICHPGPCPPCPAVIRTNCHCQRTQLSIRCSQLHTTRTTAGATTSATPLESTNYSQELSCDQVCNKLLSCGMHSCQKTCHPGPCGECQAIRDKSCYCGKSKLIDERCRNRIEFDDPIMTIEAQKNQHGKVVCVSSDGRSEWVGEFQCRATCEWKYQCGIHACNSVCHPHTETTPELCPYSPELITSCPCGSTPLELSSRKSCSDPIPTCQNTCGKPLESCGHPCPNICHLGPCPSTSCKTLVTTHCRCGRDEIIRECKEIERLKKESLIANSLIRDENERQDESEVTRKAIEYTCERRCRVLRNCGKHTCNRSCCPLSCLETILYQKKSTNKNQNSDLIHQDQDLHTCTLICNKKLSCGSHSCQLQDHKGPCPPCLLATFDPLICNCGLTVIEPPIRCGTKMNCQHSCRRGGDKADCGHPIIPHQCHEEPECPPCVFLTSKPCQCDKKNTVKNVRCSQPSYKISCAQKCNNLLSCGAHRCQLVCHPSGLCQPCLQVCLKPRKHCGHSCREKCHAPTVCKTEEECQEMITIKCQCGHVSSTVKCKSCDDEPEGNRNQTVECTQECETNRRNLELMEALQINKPTVTENSTSRSSSCNVEYSVNLMKFFKSHTAFAKTIEAQLDRFLSPCFPLDTSTIPHSASLTISTCSKLKQNFLVELIAYYQIKFLPPMGLEPKYNVKLIKDDKSTRPVKLLSQAYLEMKEEEMEEMKKGDIIKNTTTTVTTIAPGKKQVIHSRSNIDERSSNRFNILSSSSPFNNNNTTTTSGGGKFTSAWFNSGPDRHLGQVISGGFNKPPIAVLAPVVSSTSLSNRSGRPSSSSRRIIDDSDVVDDWENHI